MNKAKTGLSLLLIIIVMLCMLSSYTFAFAENGDWYTKYETLLNDPKIANAISWVVPDSSWTYSKWTVEQKDQLKHAIERIENGEPFPMEEPPKLIKDDTYISEEDAWTIYLSRVAHALWLESNQIVNWSILDYTEEERKILLSAEYMFISHPKKIIYTGISRGFTFYSWVAGDVTDWNIDISYQFMKENGYIFDDPASCAYAFGGWLRLNIGHFTGGSTPDNYEKIWGYRGPPPVDRILYPTKVRDGRVDSAGCWGTTGLFIAVMRSINIPATHNFVQFWVAGRTDQGGFHSALQLPTLGIGLIHSDDFNYQGVIETVPTEKIFASLDWLEEYIYEPVVLDQSDTYQNRPQDQAAYNKLRRSNGLLIEYLDNRLLSIRAQDASQNTKPTALIKSLTVNSGYYGNEGTYYYEYAKPNYTEDELQQIIERIDNELIRIGNGDWCKGASIIRDSGKPIILDLASENPTYQLELAVASLPWQSSNDAVVTISSTGLVIGTREGTATITAVLPKDSKFNAPSSKVIVRYNAKSIQISGSDSVASGKKISLTANVFPTETTNKQVSWKSMDPEIATVSNDGVVTAKNISETKTVTITATAKDGSGVVAEHMLTILPVAQSVQIMHEDVDVTTQIVSIDLLAQSQTLQVSATIIPTDAGQSVLWSSLDRSIATVSEDGIVTGLKQGIVTIIATSADGSGVKASFKVKVANLTREITITGDSTIVGGKRTTLKAEVLPKETSNKKVTWESSDEEVATVSTEGVVTAKKVDETKTVTITATAQDGSSVTVAWVVTVIPAVQKVSVLQENVDCTSETLTIDLLSDFDTLQLTALVSPSQADQSITWRSSDKSIATVSEDGLVTGLIKGIVTITATSVSGKTSDGSAIKASCKVKVSNLAKEIIINGENTLAEGHWTILKAEVLPKTTSNKSVTWESSDKEIAIVNNEGKVTAKQVNETKIVTITATAQDGSGIVGEWVITVTPAE